MSDIMKVGASTLLAVQQALTTTGHNIANVNTPGYSRQTAVFSAQAGRQLGFGVLGSGATVTSVIRTHDEFLADQVQGYASSKSRYEAFLGLTSRLDDLMANTSNSLNVSLNNFFNAVQDLSANPAGLPERQVLLGEAGNLAMRQQKLAGLMEDLDREVNSRLDSLVSEVNSYADSIDQLNRQIVRASNSGTGNMPNDLLDQRDQLIKQLAEKVSVTSIPQQDGSVDVYIGQGQGLVVGSQVTHLETVPNPLSPTQLDVALESVTGGHIVSQFLSGGEVQGLMDFRSRVLRPAQSQLGLLSLGLKETLNAMHRAGMDLDGAMGGDFFSSAEPTLLTHSSNEGNAAPAVTLSDVTQLRASDYRLDYDGTQWTLTRLLDDTSVSGAGPLTLDGIEVALGSGTPQAGDRFEFNPARDGLQGFRLALSDPRRIAAALPLRATRDPDNAGSAQAGELTALPGNTLPLGASISLTFDPDALGPGQPGFDVTGGPGGTLAYDPTTEGGGKTFTFAAEGFSFQLSGTPQDGDLIVLADNQGGVGDNGNALRLASLQNSDLLEGGNGNYQELYGNMVARIGVATRDADTNLSVEASLLEQAEIYRESVSGVSLDEEAANMLRYQQLYQAAAQLVKTADTLFQTLLNATR